MEFEEQPDYLNRPKRPEKRATMDYLYIRAWGKLLCSLPYYVEREIEKARRANAPQTAIYQRQDGSWATFGQIRSGDTRDAIAALVQQMRQLEKEDEE